MRRTRFPKLGPRVKWAPSSQALIAAMPPPLLWNFGWVAASAGAGKRMHAALLCARLHHTACCTCQHALFAVSFTTCLLSRLQIHSPPPRHLFCSDLLPRLAGM